MQLNSALSSVNFTAQTKGHYVINSTSSPLDICLIVLSKLLEGLKMFCPFKHTVGPFFFFFFLFLFLVHCGLVDTENFKF